MRGLPINKVMFDQVSVLPILERIPKLYWLKLSPNSIDTQHVGTLTNLQLLEIKGRISFSLDVLTSLTNLQTLTFDPKSVDSNRASTTTRINFSPLLCLTNLQELSFGREGGYDETFQDLAPLTQLTELDIGSTTQLKWKNFNQFFLEKPKLKKLTLRICLPDDNDLWDFFGCTQLVELIMTGGNDWIVGQISRNLTKLKSLHLSGGWNFTDTIFPCLARLTRLRTLKMTGILRTSPFFFDLLRQERLNSPLPQ